MPHGVADEVRVPLIPGIVRVTLRLDDHPAVHPLDRHGSVRDGQLWFSGRMEGDDLTQLQIRARL
jgi:hypothetical protein